MGERTYTVTGMSCTGCESNVEEALAAVPGIRDVDADHAADRVTVAASDEVTDDQIRSKITAAGYEPR